MSPVAPLSPDQLYTACDPAGLPFETTEDLPDEATCDLLGQERAMSALRFGISIRHQGYHVFALGPAGTGKHSVVRQVLEQKARAEPVPPDLCYVNNFADAQRPKVLQLPPGRGQRLRKDMAQLIEELRVAIPAAFETEDYRTRRQIIEKELEDRHEQSFGALEKRAEERGLLLLRTPIGLAIAPAQGGAVITPQEFEALPEERQRSMREDISSLQEELQQLLKKVPDWHRESRARERDLRREVIGHAVALLIEGLRQKYEDLEVVVRHLDDVHKDIVDHVDEFVPSEGAEPGTPAAAEEASPDERILRNYQVNVLTDRGGMQGAPVVYEDHPTHANLIGRIEHIAQYGALVTDFNLIKAGALHRANGGYLIIDAHKVLEHPLAWEQLKRALYSKELRVESIEQALSLVSTVSLEPEPVPLSVKVVLLGERVLYYMLSQLDPEFPALFKVAADFEDHIDRNEASQLMYARLIAHLSRSEGLLPLSREAVARAIEYSARRAEDAQKLSTHIRSLADLLREADHLARAQGTNVIGRASIQEAIEGQARRSDRLASQIRDDIRRGTLLIETRGEVIGQVNGLSVIQLGEHSFGRPSRITALVRPGRGKVVDIERASALSGPIHSKGVLILTSFIAARFAGDRPFSLSASVVFEQSYSGVDGDSASLAELFALLSALAEAPIRQCLAVTGSVDQRGQVQAIGGVQEKIEGFFDVCRMFGLRGVEGVLIPRANVSQLMLRSDVVEAVARGEFHIYPIEHVDQGIEVLTGLPAGTARADGTFPEGSINHRVKARLESFAEVARARSPHRSSAPRRRPKARAREGRT